MSRPTENQTRRALEAAVSRGLIPASRLEDFEARTEAEAQSALAAPAGSASRPIASAYCDADGWCLFDASGDVIEDWPKDWPKYVDRKFIESKGIEVR